jgi:hypothetical protein
MTKILTTKFNTVGATRNVIPSDKNNENRINNSIGSKCTPDDDPTTTYIGVKIWNAEKNKYQVLPYFDCDYIE